MKITTIIPVINLWKEYTENCINSLARQILPEDCLLNLIIIDNGSTDETKERIEEKIRAGISIQLIRNEENLGVAKSWNLGIKKAFEEGADYCFVINNDTIFEEKCIRELVERMNKNNIVLISPTNQPECNFGQNLLIDEINGGDYSAFMIDKRLFESVGEFDEGFERAYFEDNDMEYRIKMAGLKSIKYPNALYHHFGSKTQNQVNGGIVNTEMFRKNRNYYICKWGNLGEEVYAYPFNDIMKPIKWTQQSIKK
jgi:GT2 family glycosyltransferase